MTHRERLTAQCPRLTGALAGAVLMLCVTGVSAAPGLLAQSPVLATPSSKPNVMLVIDDSGSMGSTRGGVTLMTQAKNAAKLLIDTLSSVNVGVGSFYHSGAEVDHPIVDVDKNRAALKNTIDSLRARGGTPLIATMQQMGHYFVGAQPPNSPGNSSLASCAENGQYGGELTLHPDGAKKNYRVTTVLPRSLRSGSQRLQSPICHYCQKNFIILLTDGQGWGRISSGLRNYAPGCKGQSLCNVAAGLYDIDLRPDIDTFEGKEVKNNVITYTIGFHTSQALLGDTAREGGGLYVEADNQAALTKAFAKISADIKAHARGSASTASFNTRSLSTSTHLYLTRFDTQDWSGDLMAVALAKDGTPGATKWSAGALLDTHTQHNTRAVLTYNNKLNFTKAIGCKAATVTPAAAGSNPGGVAFRYNQLSPAQKADLETMPRVSASANATYTYSTAWSAPKAREGGIAVDQKTGNVYWANAKGNGVWKYGPNGKYLGQIGRGTHRQPRAVAVDSNSNLWVADTGTHRVLKYDESGVL